MGGSSTYVNKHVTKAQAWQCSHQQKLFTFCGSSACESSGTVSELLEASESLATRLEEFSLSSLGVTG